jgi:predicted ATP-dependent serine protease
MSEQNQLFPATTIEENKGPVEPAKKNGERKIFNVKSVKEMTYQILDFKEEYSNLIGVPEARFNMMAYGPSGSGKSTWMIKFADYLADSFGKTLYACYEERTNKTLQDRINECNIQSRKLYFGRDLSFEELKKKMKANHYHFVIIDSVQYANFSIEQLEDFRMTFKKKKRMGLIFVSFGTGLGKTDGAKELLHASDVKLYFHNGKVLSHGRYIKEQIEQVIFTPLKKEAEEVSEENGIQNP